MFDILVKLYIVSRRKEPPITAYVPLSKISEHVRIDCNELITSPWIDARRTTGPDDTRSVTMWKISGRCCETENHKSYPNIRTN